MRACPRKLHFSWLLALAGCLVLPLGRLIELFLLAELEILLLVRGRLCWCLLKRWQLGCTSQYLIPPSSPDLTLSNKKRPGQAVWIQHGRHSTHGIYDGCLLVGPRSHCLRWLTSQWAIPSCSRSPGRGFVLGWAWRYVHASSPTLLPLPHY